MRQLSDGHLPAEVAQELQRMARPEALAGDAVRDVRKAEYHLRQHLRRENGPHLARAISRLLLALAKEVPE